MPEMPENNYKMFKTIYDGFSNENSFYKKNYIFNNLTLLNYVAHFNLGNNN